MKASCRPRGDQGQGELVDRTETTAQERGAVKRVFVDRAVTNIICREQSRVREQYLVDRTGTGLICSRDRGAVKRVTARELDSW